MYNVGSLINAYIWNLYQVTATQRNWVVFGSVCKDICVSKELLNWFSFYDTEAL